jgi:hypothetical protein
MLFESIPMKCCLPAFDDAAIHEKHIASTNVELSAILRRLKDECKKKFRLAIGMDKLESYKKAHEQMKGGLFLQTR